MKQVLSKNKGGLTLIIDGSLVGRGCVALVIAVVSFMVGGLYR